MTVATPGSSQIAHHPLWTTVRFRRARELKKGWAMLGIPNQVYPVVAMRLFERQAKLIDKHDAAGFTSLLFEAPTGLAAQLALTFPAPPGAPPLAIAATGDRVLSGKAAQSPKAIHQASDPGDRADFALAEAEY